MSGILFFIFASCHPLTKTSGIEHYFMPKVNVYSYIASIFIIYSNQMALVLHISKHKMLCLLCICRKQINNY